MLRIITVSCFEDNGFPPEYLEHVKELKFVIVLSPFQFPCSGPRKPSPKVMLGGKTNSFQLPIPVHE